MKPDFALDVRIAPEGALSRVSGAINKRKKRLFGVLKVENEFVGHVVDGRFEIWERQQRAIHGVGSVRARRGGSTIELRFVIPTYTRILLGAFFALYAAAAVGIATQSPDPGISAQEAVSGIAGAVVLAFLFVWGARRQRADLRAFLERTFSDERLR